MASTVTDGTANSEATWLDRAIDWRAWSLEAVAWTAVVGLALCLRLLWLDHWPLHAAEATLAGQALRLVEQGGSTAGSTVEAGPAVVLWQAVFIFLFGASDLSARAASAAIGTLIVAALWWLRPFVGNAGALTAALLLAVSPLAVYHTRQATPEPLAMLAIVVYVVASLHWQTHRRRHAWPIAVGAAVIAVESHFPTMLFVVGLAPLALLATRLVQPGGPLVGQALPATTRQTGRAWGLLLGIVVVLLVVLGVLGSGGSDPLFAVLQPLVQWGTVFPPFGRAPFFVPSLLLLYEPLLLIGALLGAWSAGAPSEPAERRGPSLFLVFWATLGLLVASLTGDRDPAQSLYALVPLALGAGRAFAALLAGLRPAEYARRGGPLLSSASAVLLVLVVVFVASVSAASGGTNVTSTQVTSLFMTLVLLLLALTATGYALRHYGWRPGARVVALTLIGVLCLYETRSMVQLAYVRPAGANEPAVQSQTAPGVTDVMERLKRLSRDLTATRRDDSDLIGGRSLDIVVEQPLLPVLGWYLHGFSDVSEFQPDTGLTARPSVVLLTASSEAVLRANLERTYVGQRYPFRWGFPTDGWGQGLGLGPLVRFLLYRETAVLPATEEFAVYLRRDVADRVLFKGGSLEAPAGPPVALLDRVGRGRGPGQFDSPRGIASDASGNTYVVDTVNARLQKFDAGGNHLWSVGSPGAGQGQFGQVPNGPGPTGVVVDATGNVFVADTWNHRIVKLDPNGRFITAWGKFVVTQGLPELNAQNPADFYGPRGLAIGPDGALYVTDTGNKRVLVFDLNGKPLRQFGSVGSGPTNLDEPVGIAIDASGTVYVADTNNERIAAFDAQGKPVTQWPVSGWVRGAYQEPYLASDGQTIWVTNGPAHSVVQFDRTGKLLQEVTRIGTVELIAPTGIAVGPGGIYVVDTAAHAVLKLR